MLSLPVADGRNPRRRKATEAPPEDELSAALRRHRRSRLDSSDGEEDEGYRICTESTKSSQRGIPVRYMPDNNIDVGLQRIKHQLKVSPSHASNSGCSNLLEGLTLQQHHRDDTSGSYFADSEDLSSVALGPIRATSLSFVSTGEDLLRKASSFADLAAQAAAVPRAVSNAETTNVGARPNTTRVPNSPLGSTRASVSWEVPVTRTSPQMSGNATSRASFLSLLTNTSTINDSLASSVVAGIKGNMSGHSRVATLVGAPDGIPCSVPLEAAASQMNSMAGARNGTAARSSSSALNNNEPIMSEGDIHEDERKEAECDDYEAEEQLRAAFLERERNRRHRRQLPVRVRGPSGSSRASGPGSRSGSVSKVLWRLLRFIWIVAPWLGLLAMFWFRQTILTPQSSSDLGNNYSNGNGSGSSNSSQRCQQYYLTSLGSGNSGGSSGSWSLDLVAAVGCLLELASNYTHIIAEVREGMEL